MLNWWVWTCMNLLLFRSCRTHHLCGLGCVWLLTANKDCCWVRCKVLGLLLAWLTDNVRWLFAINLILESWCANCLDLVVLLLLLIHQASLLGLLKLFYSRCCTSTNLCIFFVLWAAWEYLRLEGLELCALLRRGSPSLIWCRRDARQRRLVLFHDYRLSDQILVICTGSFPAPALHRQGHVSAQLNFGDCELLQASWQCDLSAAVALVVNERLLLQVRRSLLLIVVIVTVVLWRTSLRSGHHGDGLRWVNLLQ